MLANSLGVFVEAPNLKTYILDLDAGGPYTITQLSIQTRVGTATIALQRNGVAISGAGSVAVSNVLTQVPLNQPMAVDDQLAIAVTAASGVTDLSASIRTNYGAVNIAGDTMTGLLVLSGNATANLNPVPLQQLNSSLPTLPLAVAQGGTGATTAPAALTALGAAPIASPALTGTPTAPTAAPGTNTTQVATTAFAVAGDALRVAKAGDTMSGGLTINQSGGAPASPSSANLYVVGANGNATSVDVDSYGGPGAQPLINTRRARGTAAAPTAIQSGDPFLSVQAQGYAATTWGTATTAILAIANENWTATANGSAIYFQTAVNGTTTVVNSLELQGNTATFSGDAVLGGSANSLYWGAATTASSRITANASQLNCQLGSGNDSFNWYNTGGTGIVKFAAGGVTTNTSGTWATFSDVRLKTDVTAYDDGLAAILALDPIRFRYRHDALPDTPQVGFDAAQLQKVLPHLVGTNSLRRPGEDDGEEYLTAAPTGVVFALVNAVKTLAEKLEALEKRVNGSARKR